MTSRHVTPDFPRTIHLRVQAQFACLELAQEPLCSTALLIQRYFGPLALVLPTIWVVTAFGLTPHLSQLWGPTFQPCTQRTTMSHLHHQWSSLPASCLQEGPKGEMLPIQLWPQQKAIAISHLKPEKCVSPQASACFDLGLHLPEG